MHNRASNAFSVLQATAVTLSLAIILWSLGLPSFHFVEAANVTSFSDTLSDSAPSIPSNHTITFTTPNGVANNTTITVDFSDGPFVLGSVDFSDIDIATTSDYTVAASCGGGSQVGADVSGWPTLTLTFCNGEAGASIPANGTTTIQIGTNATGGNAQLTNPAVPGVGSSYEILLTAGALDTGSTRVAILNTVLVTASVDTMFEFTVAGVAGGSTVNTADTTGATTTATAIPFGKLDALTASTAAQDLVVTTNARNGFVVTVQSDGQLESAIGADIDGFIEGGYTTTPTAWATPTPTLGQENSYGHWGLTTDDATLTESLTNPFNVGTGGDRFVSASTTPVEVFRHDGPADGANSGQGIGTTRVGYKAEITALQEAADDYQAILTYVATPVF